MFNAMAPEALTTLLAGLLAESADWERPLDAFQIGQLKSASSIGRHLAAELAGGPAAAAAFARDLARVLDEAPVAGPAGFLAAGAATRAALAEGAGPAALGEPIADLLAAGRTHPEATQLCDRVRSLLRDLADAEITILSGPPRSGGRP